MTVVLRGPGPVWQFGRILPLSHPLGVADVSIKTWGEIVHDCFARHEYIRSKLELEVEADGLGLLPARAYMKVVRPEG